MRNLRRGTPSTEDEPPGTPVADAAVVLAAQRDAADFAPLYTRYRDDVLRYAFYCLGDWEEAADAAQEVFTNALGGLARLGGRDDAFRAWLFRIAHNEICDRLNRRRRRPTAPLDDALAIADPAASPEQRALVGDDHDRLLALLDRLPPDRRRVGELRFAGLTDGEIAAVLGKSDGAVRTAWSRAAAQLRDLMRAEYPTKESRDA